MSPFYVVVRVAEIVVFCHPGWEEVDTEDTQGLKGLGSECKARET